MKTNNLGSMSLACATLAMLCAPVSAQVVRESGTRSIAGVLHAAYNAQDSFGFFSQGGEILFADIDSAVFQVKGRVGGDHGEEPTAAPDAGPSTEPGSHEDGEGCADGGPGGLCLQVYDRASGEVICHAGRPMRPGWQRDPALACPLPQRKGNSEYILSVKLGGCSSYTPATQGIPFDVSADGATPYLLSFSLRGMASDGHLEAQTARSGP